MKILFLAKDNFMNKQNTGGLHGTKRNYELLISIWGKENVYAYSLVNEKRIDTEYQKFIYYSTNIMYRYFLYFQFRELISKKNEKKIIQFIISMKFDLVFFDGSLNGRIARGLPDNLKKVVYFHNIEKYFFKEFCIKKNRLFYIRYLSAWYNEKMMTRNIDAIICLNERDQALLKEYYGKQADMIIPVTFYDEFYKVEKIHDEKKPYLIFVGSYFEPNIQGLKWFAQYVAPNINCHILVIGKDMKKLKDQMISSSIEIVGEVDEVNSYYLGAEAVIMPIFMGAGMKVKTAEAFMFGKTMFASHEALEGYETVDLPFIYECNTAEEFIKNINEYMNLKERKKMNPDIRKVFLNKYSTESYSALLKDLLESINK